MKSENTIADSIDSQKLVQDALDLVNVDSPTGSEGEVAEAVRFKVACSGYEGRNAGDRIWQMQRSCHPFGRGY